MKSEASKDALNTEAQKSNTEAPAMENMPDPAPQEVVENIIDSEQQETSSPLKNNEVVVNEEKDQELDRAVNTAREYGCKQLILLKWLKSNTGETIET